MAPDNNLAVRLALVEQGYTQLKSEVHDMKGKVDEMHAILLQARGVRWAVISTAGVVGFVSGLLSFGWIFHR